MCVGHFIWPLEPRLLRVMCIKAVVLEEKNILDKKSVKETFRVCFLTVVHLLLIKTMSEGEFFNIRTCSFSFYDSLLK